MHVYGSMTARASPATLPLGCELPWPCCASTALGLPLPAHAGASNGLARGTSSTQAVTRAERTCIVDPDRVADDESIERPVGRDGIGGRHGGGAPHELRLDSHSI